jgi:hypothetical protein
MGIASVLRNVIKEKNWRPKGRSRIAGLACICPR